MRYGPLLVLVAICALPGVFVRGQSSQSSEPIGRVTAAFGIARVESPDGTHKGDLNTLITNGDRVRTNGGGVTVLLASRVVLKIDHDTTIALSESVDQLNVVLERGTVHVFVGERPLAAGNVCVQDPQVRAETQKGVFLASYNPQSKQGYYACEHSSLTVQSGDGTQSVALAPDKQLVVEDGRFNAAQELDRAAFNQHKISLERLGQAAKHQGAETFRLRSRMFDTQLAINQLSEAGWIDAATLQAQAQQMASKKAQKKGNSSNTSNDDGDSDENESNADGESKTLTNESSPSNERSNQNRTPADPARDRPVLTDDTPAETPAAPGTEQPVVAASNTEPPPPLDLQVENDGPGNNGRGNAFGHDRQAEPDVQASKDKGPRHEFRLDHNGNNGNGNGNGNALGHDKGPGKGDETIATPPGRDTVATPPQNDVTAPPRDTPAPKIDLDLPKDNTGGAPAPKFDLGLEGGGKAQQPKFTLSDSAPPAPKLDLDPKGAGAPAKVDLGGAGGATKGISLSGTAPKMDTAAPAPKLDLGGATPAPKIDLGGSTPAPKIDLGGAAPAPKIDLGSAAPTPRLDVTSGITRDAPAPTFEIDKAPAPVDIKTPAPELAPKLDVAKPAAELPAKIDLGGEIAAPRIDLAPKGDALAPPKLDDVAPKTITDAVTNSLAPTDVKLDAPPTAEIPTGVTKDALVGPELPTPKDLGLDVTTGTTGATADAVKSATSEVTKKVTKERRRRDRTPKTTVTPTPAPPPVVAPAPPPPDTTATPAPTGGGSSGG
jgi:hypothetical protein